VDILCSRVATYEDVVVHPQVVANRMIGQAQHPVLGTIRMPGFLINSTESNAQPHGAAPENGRDTLGAAGCWFN